MPEPTIRPWEPGDRASLVRHANDAGVARNLRNRFPHPYTEADADAFIEAVRKEEPPRKFAIDVDGLAVGGVGLTPLTDVEAISAELGYWVGRQHWGRGLATLAAERITTYGFESMGLHRIFALSFAHNQASMRVVQKLGFRYEGTLREAAVKNGELVDLVVHAITRPEWVGRAVSGDSQPMSR